MPTKLLSDAQVSQWQADGYHMERGLFTPEEIDLLRRAAKEDRAMDEHALGRADGEGGTVRLSLWNHPGEGIYGMIARCRRVVERAEQLLDDEVYHYHSKMIMKDAKIGGAWAWHQDYGYWYKDCVLCPDLLSVFIAVDPSTKENGCLQVLRGSHRLGRIDHVLTGQQSGADPDRVEAARKHLELVHCLMEPGDALFFHANTLHRSDQNRSDNPRWSMICCYNSKHNDPYAPGKHPNYTPLSKVDDNMVLKAGTKRFGDGDDPGWLSNTARSSAARLAAGSGDKHG
ncbi:MAG: phytanoyl-CoA dioxygenase family protein [Planctomycetes bacterium]|nr:phytanoyl-CoA dioxygenase family protein [Planctomycetota bacterium]